MPIAAEAAATAGGTTSTNTNLADSPPSPVNAGQQLTLTATVTASDGTVPPGSVNFVEGGSSLPINSAPVTVNAGGVATFAFVPAVGSYSFQAIYIPPLGSTIYGFSSSNIITYVVNPVSVDNDLTVHGLPQDQVLDATSPAGAVFTYAPPTVTDEDSPAPTIQCSPSSGTFPIGGSMVYCTISGTDDVRGFPLDFKVIVEGADYQALVLQGKVKGVGPGKSLYDKLGQVQADLTANNNADACGTLNDFIHQVNALSGNKITAELADQLVTSAEQIQAVIGCP